MKKSCKALAILLAALTMSTGVMAAEEIKQPVSDTTTTIGVTTESILSLPRVSKGTLKINGTKIELSKTPLMELEGNFFLPMRKFAMLFGLSDENIIWSNDTKEASIDFGGMKFTYNTVTGISYLNENVYDADTVFVEHNGIVYMKARFLCNFLNGNISWEPATASLSISKSGIEVPEEMVYVEPEPVKGRRYTAEELDLLARIVEAEAKDQPYEGRIAVANVVLNRVDSSKFPNTIYDVVYAKNQFSPVRTGEINKKASELSVKAAVEAFEGREITDALYFNATWVTGSWASRNRDFCMKLGTHVFYH